MSRAQPTLAGSPAAHRVGKREASWLEPVHAGHASGGRPASVASTSDRMAAAWNGEKTKEKLKPRSSSSPWP